jgi:hypothetical protein
MEDGALVSRRGYRSILRMVPTYEIHRACFVLLRGYVSVSKLIMVMEAYRSCVDLI